MFLWSVSLLWGFFLISCPVTSCRTGYACLSTILHTQSAKYKTQTIFAVTSGGTWTSVLRHNVMFTTTCPAPAALISKQWRHYSSNLPSCSFQFCIRSLSSQVGHPQLKFLPRTTSLNVHHHIQHGNWSSDSSHNGPCDRKFQSRSWPRMAVVMKIQVLVAVYNVYWKPA